MNSVISTRDIFYWCCQFSSVPQSCPTLCNSTDYNTAGFPALHCLSEFALTPLSWWCHPTISSSVNPFSSCLLPFPSIRVFSNESALPIRWPKYWSFSFSIGPSNEYSGVISFRMDWLDLLAVQGTLKRLPQHHSLKASILQLCLLDDPTLIHTWLLEQQ